MKTNALWLTAGIDLGLLANLKLTKVVIGIINYIITIFFYQSVGILSYNET